MFEKGYQQFSLWIKRLSNGEARNPGNSAAKRRCAGQTLAERTVASPCEGPVSGENDVTIGVKNHGKPVAQPAKLSSNYALRKSGLKPRFAALSIKRSPRWPVFWSARQSTICLAKPNFRSAISSCASAPKPFRSTCAKKKRLPRVCDSLPVLRPECRVSGLSSAPTAQHSWAPFFSARLLLLPSMWRPVSLG